MTGGVDEYVELDLGEASVVGVVTLDELLGVGGWISVSQHPAGRLVIAEQSVAVDGVVDRPELLTHGCERRLEH